MGAHDIRHIATASALERARRSYARWMSIAAEPIMDMGAAEAQDVAEADLECHRALQESMDLRDQGHSDD